VPNAGNSLQVATNLSDEGDNHLIELAVAASASIIATSNVKDFLHPQLKFPHIEVLSPEKLVERLMQSAP
jgi:predicted nucleic acid-binding protein